MRLYTGEEITGQGEPIGRGGYGELNLHHTNQGPVGVKRLNSMNDVLHKLYTESMRVRGIINAPKEMLPQYLGHDLSKENPWVALNFIEGKDIFRTMQEMRSRLGSMLGPEKALSETVKFLFTSIKAILDVIDHLIKHNAVHGELNFQHAIIRIVQGRLIAALIDLDLLTEAGQPYKIKNTSLGIAPEVFFTNTPQTSTDLHGLGILIMQLLGSLKSIANQHVSRDSFEYMNQAMELEEGLVPPNPQAIVNAFPYEARGEVHGLITLASAVVVKTAANRPQTTQVCYQLLDERPTKDPTIAPPNL